MIDWANSVLFFSAPIQLSEIDYSDRQSILISYSQGGK
jgi:hypothetical protein